MKYFTALFSALIALACLSSVGARSAAAATPSSTASSVHHKPGWYNDHSLKGTYIGYGKNNPNYREVHKGSGRDSYTCEMNIKTGKCHGGSGSWIFFAVIGGLICCCCISIGIRNVIYGTDDE